MFHRTYNVARLALAALITAVLPAAAAAADVAAPFRDYYNRRDGMRVLGGPLTDRIEVDGVPAQYFEKGRIEDHSAAVKDPDRAYMYGRLAAELMERCQAPVNATTTICHGLALPPSAAATTERSVEGIV